MLNAEDAAPSPSIPLASNQSEPRSPLRRLVRRACITAAILLPILCLAFCVGSPLYYMDKYSARGHAHPSTFPADFIPEHQTEPHTCGLHALSTIYRAYGLDPDALALRFRCGVDKPFTNFAPGSTGTIHPDMFRVLYQDGFATTLADPGDALTPRLLAEHLDDGQCAIALTHPGGLHWVVICARRDDNIRICDSLCDEPYEEPLQPFLRDKAYSLILVAPLPARAR